MKRLLIVAATATFLTIAAGAQFAAADNGAPTAEDDSGFEVWAVDQSNTRGTTSGGTLYVYPGDALNGSDAAAAVPARIDLGGATTSLCIAQTGSAPIRPHMIVFTPTHSHAVLAFVASGHVVFYDAVSRTPLTCIDVGVQAHAAFPSPDGRYVLVANQNGKLLQRIATNYATNTFTLDGPATLDLASGTTPTGAPRQDPALRPDNAPICPLIDSTSTVAFVTLRGGGLFVVDATATPMQIVAEYDRGVIHGNGCGGVQSGGKMYVNSGGGTAANLDQFDLYAFALSGFTTTPQTNPNTPAPRNVFSDERTPTDSHGVALTRHGRYLWVADRSGNRIVVIDTETDTFAGEFSLIRAPGDDPSPDLLDLAPAGNRVFVSLRGPNPLSGDPHASTGNMPGVGIVRVQQGGRTGELTEVARITNLDASGVERADPHGLRVRRK